MSSDDKSPNTLLKVGVIGTIVAALCCFTPVLVVLFGAVGLVPRIGDLHPTDNLRTLAEKRPQFGISKELTYDEFCK